MQLGPILRAIGLPQGKFENCERLSVILYDGKDRIDSGEDVRFYEPIFKKNPSAFQNFSDFLTKLEKDPPCSPIGLKIDERSVVVFYKTPHPLVFLREPINPMDYMD